MVEDIFAQLAAIRQALDEELTNESHTTSRVAIGVAQPLVSKSHEIEAEDGLTKRNALCPCGSGRRFKHCHGQHRTVSHMEERPPPRREITFSTSIEGRSPGVSDQRDADSRESLQVTQNSGEDAPELPEQEVGRRREPEAAPSKRKVSSAMEMIVAGHVKVKNRRALADLLAHRRKVLYELQVVSGISPANVVRTILEEIACIEAGLEELKRPSGTLPENEWT
ncbi:SEC-C domain-containing protein [Bradyrhizobium genosp. A]|uniref:SEC-C domain-containing protein n=1 Tax=Bradyrhizobium genosp. A TaxID=83626 RepID=UPI003CF892C4